MVNENTFLYAPGAERTHLFDLLSRNPAAFFGGPLEDGPMYDYSSPETCVEQEINQLAYFRPQIDEDKIASFTKSMHSRLLPEFEPNVTAFWKTSLYWKK